MTQPALDELDELLGIQPVEPRPKEEMCACGILPAPCGCVTFVLPSLPTTKE